MDAYLDTLEIDFSNMKKIQNYLELVRRRSNGMQNLYHLSLILNHVWAIGTLLTPATWIRKFVQSHSDYQKDSVVSQEINYDLLLAVDEM